MYAMNDTILKLAGLLYNLILLAGTAYLVVNYDWSMWTFALTGLFSMVNFSKKSEPK